MVAALLSAARAEAVSAFEALGLCTQLAEAAADLGWKSPSPVQQQAVPLLLQGTSPGGQREVCSHSEVVLKRQYCHFCRAATLRPCLWLQGQRYKITHAFLLSGRDVIGLAETGSGKTGAFVLPILQVLKTSFLTEVLRWSAPACSTAAKLMAHYL